MPLRTSAANMIIRVKENPCRAVANGMLVLFLCVYTLILHNHLFDLMRTRYCCLLAITCTGILVCAIMRIIDRKKNRAAPCIRTHALCAADLFFVLFLICSIFACLLSEYPQTAWLGVDSRYMGTLTFLVLFCAYYVLTRHASLFYGLVYLLGIVVILAVSVGYLHFVGIDPLHLMDGIRVTGQKDFISVFGNINVYSSFLCLCVPVFMLCYCRSEKADSLFELIVCVFCFIGLFTANSDSGYIGFGAAFLFLSLLCLRHSARAVRQCIKLLAVFCITAILFSFANAVSNGSMRLLSPLTQSVTSGYAAYILLACCILLLLILQKKEPSAKLRTILFVTLSATAVIVLIGTFAAVLFFSVEDKQTDLGYWSRYLRFNDKWGTGRGFIWRCMAQIIERQPWYGKMFGSGAQTIGKIMWENFRPDMNKAGYQYIDDAHNEFLQILVTHGLFGLMCYLGFLLTGILYPLLRKKPLLNQAFALGALCYFVQSVVNLHQIVTTPLLFLFVFAALTGNVSYSEASGTPRNT